MSKARRGAKKLLSVEGRTSWRYDDATAFMDQTKVEALLIAKSGKQANGDVVVVRPTRKRTHVVAAEGRCRGTCEA